MNFKLIQTWQQVELQTPQGLSKKNWNSNPTRTSLKIPKIRFIPTTLFIYEHFRVPIYEWFLFHLGLNSTQDKTPQPSPRYENITVFYYIFFKLCFLIMKMKINLCLFLIIDQRGLQPQDQKGYGIMQLFPTKSKQTSVVVTKPFSNR